MKTLSDVAKAAEEFCAYLDQCKAAGVDELCSHGFRWNRCLDGCRVYFQNGRLHFEQKVGEKRYICRGHILEVTR